MKICEKLEQRIEKVSKPPMVDIIKASKLKEINEDLKTLQRMCRQVETLCPLNFCKEIENKYKL